jgi:prolyl oligopeptidase PreP (S9A serine peptidase family)
MEEKLDESSNFKFLEDKTSKEDLLWVTQKGDTVTTFFMKMPEDRNQPGAIEEIISSTLRYALVYICYLHHCHKGICRRKKPLVQIMDPEKSQCIQKNNTLEVKTSGLIV